MSTILLEQYGDEVNAPESVLLRAVKNPWKVGTAAFVLLFNRGVDEVRITERVVQR